MYLDVNLTFEFTDVDPLASFHPGLGTTFSRSFASPNFMDAFNVPFTFDRSLLNGGVWNSITAFSMIFNSTLDLGVSLTGSGPNSRMNVGNLLSVPVSDATGDPMRATQDVLFGTGSPPQLTFNGDINPPFTIGNMVGGMSVTQTVVYPGAVPVPAAVWLFASGILTLLGIARRKRTA